MRYKYARTHLSNSTGDRPLRRECERRTRREIRFSHSAGTAAVGRTAAPRERGRELPVRDSGNIDMGVYTSAPERWRRLPAGGGEGVAWRREKLSYKAAHGEGSALRPSGRGQPCVPREAHAEMPLRSAGNRIYCTAVRWELVSAARGRRGQRDRHNCEVMPAKVRCAIVFRRGFLTLGSTGGMHV